MDIKKSLLFTFSQSSETVWEYLTNSELLAQWLMPNDFKPIVGHKFQFGAKPKLKFGFDGRIYCEVLEIVPYKKLVYSWKGGLSKENPSQNYLAYIIMNKGWAKIGKRLFKQLNPA